MRRKRSDELPRFEEDYPDPLNFRWRRRYSVYIAVFLLIVYLLLPSHTASSTSNDGSPGTIDWSKYAYSLYATDSATLCHALLVFDALARLGSKADRVLFYPNYWDTVIRDSMDRDSQLLVLARDRYKVQLQPIQLLTVEGRAKGMSYIFFLVVAHQHVQSHTRKVSPYVRLTPTPYIRCKFQVEE
jgi:hypothetical protein